MANKKISQLVGMGTSEAVSGFYLLPVGAGSSTGPYTTKKITTKELADFIFTGDNSAYVGFPAGTLSGVNKDIYFNNNDANWVNASNTDVASFPYLQVRKSDGLIVTGSGVAFDSATTPWNYDAASDINMQDNNIGNVGSEITFQDGGNIGSSAGGISINSPDANTKISLTAPEVEINGSSEIDLNGPVTVQGNLTNTGGDLTVEDIIIENTSRHLVNDIGAGNNINWSLSNIQKVGIGTDRNYNFTNALHGQTLTMYIKNTDSSTSILPTFASGSYVKWGGTGGPPHIDGARTNVYTFVCYDQVIFASAITGYVF